MRRPYVVVFLEGERRSMTFAETGRAIRVAKSLHGVACQYVKGRLVPILRQQRDIAIPQARRNPPRGKA